jgi:hypothetical protein
MLPGILERIYIEDLSTLLTAPSPYPTLTPVLALPKQLESRVWVLRSGAVEVSVFIGYGVVSMGDRCMMFRS